MLHTNYTRLSLLSFLSFRCFISAPQWFLEVQSEGSSTKFASPVFRGPIPRFVRLSQGADGTVEVRRGDEEDFLVFVGKWRGERGERKNGSSSVGPSLSE